MLSPQQVLPFLRHEDPIVRNHVGRYFRDSYDFGPLTAEDYWGVIDRLGETEDTLGFAADLSDLPQTDASVDRLIGALGIARLDENFTYHFQRAIRDLDMGTVSRNRGKLLGCAHISEDVRKHLELRLSLVDEPAMSAWDRLMEHGRELGGAYVGKFSFGLSDALIEAAARGGTEVCERAMAMLADESACEDWREIFAVKTLGAARYEPAIEALVDKYAVDADVLREEVTRTLSRIGTPEVVDRIVTYYPGKLWHIRLFACDPLAKIKRPESEAALLKLLEVEKAIEAHPIGEDEGEPLTDHLMHDLLSLCSLAGLEQTLDQIARFPGGSMWGDLRQDLLAVSMMNGVSLPEEAEWRKLIEEEEKQRDSRRAMFDAAARNLTTEPKRKAPKAVVDHYYESGPVAQIRNAGPKIGRNDICPCGSGKKYKKCCGKK